MSRASAHPSVLTLYLVAHVIWHPCLFNLNKHDFCDVGKGGQNVIYQQDLGILNPRIEDP